MNNKFDITQGKEHQKCLMSGMLREPGQDVDIKCDAKERGILYFLYKLTPQIFHSADFAEDFSWGGA
jgi:hypothetical protein